MQVAAPGPAPTPAPPNAPAVWYRRVGLEARNVTITILVGFLALALLVGAVILVTALAVR